MVCVYVHTYIHTRVLNVERCASSRACLRACVPRLLSTALFSQADAALARGAVFEVTYSQAILSEFRPCLSAFASVAVIEG